MWSEKSLSGTKRFNPTLRSARRCHLAAACARRLHVASVLQHGPGWRTRHLHGFLALDEDGTTCSSDYYLRLTGAGGRMLKGQIALTAVRPTPPVAGGGTTTVISLRAVVNNRYVCAESAGAQPLIANRTATGLWEQFDLSTA
jgi:hypothetical protein